MAQSMDNSLDSLDVSAGSCPPRSPMCALFANKGAPGGDRPGERGRGPGGAGPGATSRLPARRTAGGLRGANGQGSALTPRRRRLWPQRFGPRCGCSRCRTPASFLGLCCLAVSCGDMWRLSGLTNAGRAVGATGMMKGEKEARKFGVIWLPGMASLPRCPP